MGVSAQVMKESPLAFRIHQDHGGGSCNLGVLDHALSIKSRPLQRADNKLPQPIIAHLTEHGGSYTQRFQVNSRIRRAATDMKGHLIHKAQPPALGQRIYGPAQKVGHKNPEAGDVRHEAVSVGGIELRTAARLGWKERREYPANGLCPIPERIPRLPEVVPCCLHSERSDDLHPGSTQERGCAVRRGELYLEGYRGREDE